MCTVPMHIVVDLDLDLKNINPDWYIVLALTRARKNDRGGISTGGVLLGCNV